MPRLLKRPPKYGRHKASGQACVYVNGREVYLGKYGSDKSHQRYREFLADWRTDQAVIEKEEAAKAAEDSLAETLHPAALRRKRREGGVVTIDELIFVYRRHASSYYVKYGKVTREAELIGEGLKLLLQSSTVQVFGVNNDESDLAAWVSEELGKHTLKKKRGWGLAQ